MGQLPPERRLPDARQPALRQHHPHRPPGAQHRLQRGVQGRRRRRRARGVPGQDRRPSRCPAHQRPPTQQGAAAVRQGRDRHQAGTGDLCRRRRLQPWRHRRRPRPRRALLPAHPGHPGGCRPRHADRGLPGRERAQHRRPGHLPGADGLHRPLAGRPARRGGLSMATLGSTAVAPRSGDNATLAFDVERVRHDFPVLQQHVHGKPLVYLDSGASAQKPAAVLETMDEVYRSGYANVHRGAYYFSQHLTDRYEGVRATVARFLNAGSDQEIVFTRNVTEAINLVAHSYGSKLQPGDEVVISEMEHHANIVPWQLLRDRAGINLKVVPIADDGSFRLDAYEALLGPRTKLVAVTHTSNVLGTVTPMAEIIRLAHRSEEHTSELQSLMRISYA